MDISTAVGVLLGITFLIVGILISGDLGTYFDEASVLITFGGTIAATLISFPLPKLIETMKSVKHVFFGRELNAGEAIEKIIELANTARKEGLLALEEAAMQLDDDFLKKGILLIVDGTDPELVRSILETELSFVEERHSTGQSLFETMGAISPAFGMIGTLIGLINMLRTLEDVSKVGPNMAVALITTFYGAVMAYLFFLPMARKLKLRSKEEIFLKEILVEGMLSIQAGENPRIIEEKLVAFLSPKTREKAKKDKNKESGEEAYATAAE
jgi:chemotaxis protein MotA